jgi:hypothetical protein
MYSVSSSYAYEITGKNAGLRRVLTIGGSDYSAYVLRWPSISKQWDALSPQTVTIDLTNANGAFNFLNADPTKMRSAAIIKLHVVDSAGTVSSDYLSLFNGTTDAARYSGAGCSLTLIDKFRKLTERKIGSTTTPTNYTGSSYLVHDMAWYACTSLTGLSAIASTSNPDIDYTSFTSWSSVFSADNVRVKAQFTGQQPAELLKKLSRLTQSAIFIENDRIKFARYSLAGVASDTLNNATVLDYSATLDDRELINKILVSGAYDTTSRSFGLTVFDTSSSSQVNYGLKESLVAEDIVWLVDSVSALNLAQRIIHTSAEVKNKFIVKTTLQGALSTIGDTIVYTNPLLAQSDTFRIMGETFDLNNGTKSFEIDQTQYFGGFMLDVSALDSVDILT